MPTLTKENVFTKYLRIARDGFSHFWKRDYYIVAAFFVPFFILLVAYLSFGVYPMDEGRSVLSLDLNGQYVYYYDYMYDVLAGKESLFYSWSRNLSGEFMGIMGYYLGSPFNFIVWLFPREHITEGLLLMMITKVGAIGACTAVYLGKWKKYSPFTTIIFSAMFALCSYTMEQTMNPMWLDGLMALPLICMGIEQVVKKYDFRLLVIALAYSFVTCFYIGYMLGIFAAIYFVYYVIASGGLKRTRLLGSLKSTINCGLAAVCAVFISSYMIIPVYNSLSYGKFEFSTPVYTPDINFTLMELFDKLLPNSYDTVRMIGLPFLYCGVLTLILVPLYFLCKKVSVRERICTAVLLAFMVICMYVRPIDMLWHGGQMPNWLPYRYSFIISFLLICCGAVVFENLKTFRSRTIGVSVVVIIGLTLHAETIDHFIKELGSKGRNVFDSLTVVLPALAIIAIIGIVLVNHKRLKPSNFTPILVFVVCCELFYNTITAICKQDQDIVYSSRASYNDVILPTREVVQGIKKNDDGFYRIEKNFFRTTNDPLALNMYGLSHSSSTLNSKPIELLKTLGFTSRSHYTRYSGATPITDDIFGVKYILNTDTNATSDITSKDDIMIESNLDALPLAYLVDNEVMNYVPLTDEPFANQNNLFSAMEGNTSPKSYLTLFSEDEIVLENVKKSKLTDGHTMYKIITSGINAQVEFKLTAPRTGELFMYLPTGREMKTNLWINTKWGGNYFEADNYCIKSLGEFNEGDPVSVILTLTKDTMYYKETQFAYIDKEMADATTAYLNNYNKDTTLKKESPTHLTMTVNAPEDCILLTTIPDEKGWKMTLDGKETPYNAILDGALMSIPVTAGQHTITMKFTTAGYPFAIYLSIGGVILFAAMILVFIKFKKFDLPTVIELEEMNHDDDQDDNQDDDNDDNDDSKNEEII